MHKFTVSIISLFFSFYSISLGAQAREGNLLGTWSDSTLVGSERFDNTYNEVWGVVVDGIEYAIIGSTYGTHFIDVSDPQTPTEVYVLEGADQGSAIIHRDYHDYNGFLYAVADEGDLSTLQVMDLSFLPDSVSVVYDSQELIFRTHNIFIDTSSAIMYACITAGTDHAFSPLRLFDISDPRDPQVIAAYRNFDGFFVSQVHDTYVRNDTAYLNCAQTGLIIADFSDPTEPVALGILPSFDYPQSGYNHSGWLSDDGHTYVFADENWGMDVKVLDVSDPSVPTLLDTIDAESPSPLSIPHNQVISGEYLYVSYYYDGLQVYDISDPNNTTRVLYYPTSSKPFDRNYEGAWGVYPFLPSGNILVSDMQEGLFVIQAVDPIIGSTSDQSIDSDWRIYPNPVYKSFNIKGENIQIDSEVLLKDHQGRIVQRFNKYTEEYVLDPKLPEGHYLLCLYNDDGQTTKSLIIVK